MLKTIFLSAVLTAFMSPSLSLASWELITDFSLNLPSPFIDQQVDEILQNFASSRFNVADQTLNLGFPVTLSGITVQLSQANPTTIVLQSGKSWQLASNALGAEVTIGEINASQTITETINGVILNVRLDAVCRGLTLNLPPGSASVSANLDLTVQSNQAALSLSDFKMNWVPGNWQVGPIQCTGAAGFDHQVAAQIAQTLASPSGLQTLLQNYIQEQMSQSLAAGLGQLFQSVKLETGRTDIVISVQTQAMSEIAGGYQFEGQAHFLLPNASPGQTAQETLPSLPARTDLGNVSSAYVTMPRDVVAKILLHIHETDLLKRTFTSDSVPSIKGLLHSRFDQFFVFPDLMNFSKQAVFNLYTAVPAQVNFAPAKGGSSSTPGLTGSIGALVNIQTFASVAGQYVPYVTFTSPLQAGVSVRVSSGKMSCALKNVKMNLKARWDPSYLAAHHPDTRIWMGVISGSVKSALTGSPLVTSLPDLKIGNLSFTADDLQTDEAAGVLDLFFKPN